jgi:hypothetical protein
MNPKPKEVLQVLFNGEHIADLELLGYDQPIFEFRLTALTSDTDKLHHALCLESHKYGETILMSSTKKWYYRQKQFGAAMRENGIVTIRFFGGPTHIAPDVPET